MIGDERARFCGQCELNVYNLSTMSTLEAESLIARTEGRLCVRYYRRKDGSIITQDCPVGLRRLKQRAARIKRAVASLVLGCGLQPGMVGEAMPLVVAPFCCQIGAVEARKLAGKFSCGWLSS